MSTRGIYDRKGEMFGYMDQEIVYDLDGNRIGVVHGKLVHDVNDAPMWLLDGAAI